VFDIAYVGRFGRRLLLQGDYAQPTRFRDPASGMNIYEAFNQLDKVMNTSTLAYNGSCLTNPASCPVIPVLRERILGNGSLLGQGYRQGVPVEHRSHGGLRRIDQRPGWADVLRALDVATALGGNSVYNTKFDPQRDGRVMFTQPVRRFPGVDQRPPIPASTPW